MGADPLTLTLDLSRADRADRPFEFVFASQTYRMHSAGGGVSEATLAWDQALLADLAAMRQPRRDPDVVQRFGDRLRGFLAPTRWPVLEAQLCEAVQQQRRVVVTIRAAAAELYALPWELMTIAATGQHIGELPEVLVRYEWPDTETVPRGVSAGGPGGGGRWLLAWSGHVPAADHQAAIQQARAAATGGFDPARDVLPDASVGRLSRALEAAAQHGPPIEVLHLLCHGTVTGSAFGFALDDDEAPGRVLAADAAQLRRILAPHAAMLRLVVLSACDGGNVGALGNHVGSVAQDLHRAGIAAVVASRYPLSTSGSGRLARALYAALGRHATIEDAFLAARRSLAEDAQQLDWASLQLYARLADGSQTQLAGAPAADLEAPEVRTQLAQFRAVFRTAREQIALLGGYKAFHDALQELEVPFNAIDRERKRLAASEDASAEAWIELRDPLEELQQRIERTLAALAADELRDEFDMSRRRLGDAAAALTAALAGERARLEAAMHHVRRVIGLDLSSANNRLLATARELGLGEVVAALRAVLGELSRSGDHAARAQAAIDELARLVASLGELHTRLDALVHEHDQWQEIDNNLRVLVGGPAAVLVEELALSWPLVRTSIAEVVQAAAGVDWTRAVEAAAAALAGELASKAEAGKCMASLRSLWRRCNQRFVDVDKRLLGTCEDLRSVGDTLDSQLKVIEG